METIGNIIGGDFVLYWKGIVQGVPVGAADNDTGGLTMKQGGQRRAPRTAT